MRTENGNSQTHAHTGTRTKPESRGVTWRAIKLRRSKKEGENTHTEEGVRHSARGGTKGETLPHIVIVFVGFRVASAKLLLLVAGTVLVVLFVGPLLDVPPTEGGNFALLFLFQLFDFVLREE